MTASLLAVPPESFTAAPNRAPRSVRVLYVWDGDYPWDIRAEKVCLALRRAGHEVHIVARNRAQRPLSETLPEGVVHRMRPWRWAGKLDDPLGFPAFCNPRWAALIDRAARDVRPELIIVRDLPLAPTALWVGGRRGIPVVSDMAEHYPALIRKIYEAGRQKPWDYLVRNPWATELVERWCLPRFAHTMVVIEEMIDRLAEMGIPRERVHLVSNTPWVERVAERAPGSYAARPDGTLELVYLGLLEIPRGIMEVVEATALLRDRGVKVRTRLIGAGRDAELFKARARELGVLDRELEFLGYVQNREALRIVGEADVGLIPHHSCLHWNTTIPNKLFDYMAAGLPVVSSDARPAARIVRETGAGEVFASRDAGSLADAIVRLAEPQARRARGEAGQRAVRERYHWERDAAVLLDVVERVAAPRVG